MHIYLLDINPEITKAWQKFFGETNDVTIVTDDFAHFMDTHNVDCVVSPANSYGLMDGGYDKAITDYFGKEVQYHVQNKINKKWYGEQPVGTSISIETNKEHIVANISGIGNICEPILLIHTPTMRTPEAIIDPRIIYQCMRTTLIEAKAQDVNSIVIPAFGGLCGAVSYELLAYYMFLAYKQIINFKPHDITWNDAINTRNQLNFKGE